MQYMVVGMFARYGDAEAAVTDLELAGIVGEQVEVISDIDEDSRTLGAAAEPSTKPRESRLSAIARLFGAGRAPEKPEVRDLSGEQPDYIGEQEYYANHVQEGGAVLVVRTSAQQPASRAAAILQEHGASTPGHKSPPAVRRVD